MPVFSAVAVVFGVISVINFIMYAVDKAAARHHGRRIPERVLLATSLLGGGAGGGAAMLLFRHKTRHILFVVANALGVILQAAALITLAIFRL